MTCCLDLLLRTNCVERDEHRRALLTNTGMFAYNPNRSIPKRSESTNGHETARVSETSWPTGVELTKCLIDLGCLHLQSRRRGWIQRAGGSPSRSGRRIRTRRALVGLPWRYDKESEKVIYRSHYLPMPHRVRRHESLMKITTRVRRYLGRAFGFCILTLMLTLGPGPISCRESSPCIT